MTVAGADRISINPFGVDPLDAATLDPVVKAPQHRPCQDKGLQQQSEQYPRCSSSAPSSAAGHAMIVDEPPLSAKPRDSNYADHCALVGCQDRSGQQRLGLLPTPLLKEWFEAGDHLA